MDSAGRIFFSNEVGPPYDTSDIRIVTADGTLLDEPFVRFQPTDSNRALAFAPYDSTWKGVLLALSNDGEILSIDEKGAMSRFGTGFVQCGSPTFGPDGNLYLACESENVIYRITPAEVQKISIDIKPYKKPKEDNVFDLRDKKRNNEFWVAVLSDKVFDALQVDPRSVQFGRGWAESLREKARDMNKDGLDDLLIRFRNGDAGFECGDTEATLTGRTYAGEQFSGTGSIRTVNCK